VHLPCWYSSLGLLNRLALGNPASWFSGIPLF
jgi:hypothetical protein